jgi:hypothetical protein
VSKERARRRSEREAARAAEIAAARRRRRRRERWSLLGRRLVAPFAALTASSTPGRRPDSVLARRRARQNGALAAVLVGGNGVLWLMQPGWGWRIGAAVSTVFLWPLLTVLVFDRRRSG